MLGAKTNGARHLFQTRRICRSILFHSRVGLGMRIGVVCFAGFSVCFIPDFKFGAHHTYALSGEFLGCGVNGVDAIHNRSTWIHLSTRGLSGTAVHKSPLSPKYWIRSFQMQHRRFLIKRQAQMASRMWMPK